MLPDNEVVIGRWARHFQVSPKNPFALIGAVGKDCAGAEIESPSIVPTGRLMTLRPSRTAD